MWLCRYDSDPSELYSGQLQVSSLKLIQSAQRQKDLCQKREKKSDCTNELSTDTSGSGQLFSNQFMGHCCFETN